METKEQKLMKELKVVSKKNTKLLFENQMVLARMTAQSAYASEMDEFRKEEMSNGMVV